ncbi:tetratricopeptide repeat-containing hybrid sensor histidine kinase/response regulator [Flavobacterium urumqiense]|uniref:histidine kinase n=1 Tax=Flavobacterium urumqiense TaxID=935224 RepID=A0A1H6AM46_9FLAO|nr:ATP-binding protein [Flavobacterium urumqiense]SEG48836.1 Signal transduction histidine kinase [Flavobacterium urumqiense]
MKYFFVFIFFCNSFLYSQTNEKTDSIQYYLNLSNLNIKEDSYKKALFYTQKAINYSKVTRNIEAQADQTFRLGKIYFDLKKYNDAIKTFHNSIEFYKKLEPSSNYAYCIYYLGLSYIEKKDFNDAEISFNNTKSILTELRRSDSEEISNLLNLQQGIIRKSEGNYDLASAIFKTIIAKQDNETLLNSRAEALYQIGTIEETKDRNNLALNYLNKALELSIKNKNTEQQSNVLLALSSVHYKMLDKNNAYSYLKQHLNLKESISILNNKRLEIDDYDKFKESERLKEITQIDSKNKQQEKANKFSKLISILAISLISILSLLSLSLYKNNIIRTQSNLMLKEKNKELEIAKDKAEKASNARSEFLSTVSHELRTPLNAINGITHLLLEEKPKKSQMNYLSSLKFSGDYLTKFINEILEINKIDSNKFEIEYINFNVKQLLENIQNSLKELALINNNKFILKIDSDIPDFLIGDPTKLSQVMMNLINNALKFTKNGIVSVSTKLKLLESENATIYFEVTDTGIGIPEDKLKSVFDSFSQGSIEVNRKYGGTGLGLTIVKKIIKTLGGRITLKSVVGKGSSFSFELKFNIGSDLLKVEERIKTYDDSVLMNKKILLVEDNKINQMVSAKMLENKGIICDIIDNGEEAIETARNNKFDLILMDVHLPGINGTVATEQIRKFDQKTPIIALTAISLDENREILLSFGMNDVITKPFIPEEFYSTIANYV